jgi:hypothetical protein
MRAHAGDADRRGHEHVNAAFPGARTVIADAGFVFSIAALNASFAGLGGLLIGLRSGSALRPLDALRLRQVVEFAFTNLLLAIAVQPCAALIGLDPAIRLISSVSLACILVVLPILRNRVARVDIEWGRSWAALAIGLSAIGAVLAIATAISPSSGLFELLLVVMLARPMAVFVLVLAAIDEPEPASGGGR